MMIMAICIGGPWWMNEWGTIVALPHLPAAIEVGFNPQFFREI